MFLFGREGRGEDLLADFVIADEVMAEARALAGPQDAREAVGKPLAGLKIR